MRGLCHHYRVELHNFAPNAISQAATFVGVREGFLGIPVNWDLWVHLFRSELHTLRSDASVPTRRRSSRAPRSAGSVATGSQQEAAVASAVTTTVTTAPTVPPVPAPADGDQAAIVEIPNDDAPPPGWASGRTGPRQPPSPRRGY
jgi:hypothetical protein